MESIFNPTIQPKTNMAQTIVRVLLGSFLLFAGISHLSFNRGEFLAQVPPWVPMDPDLVVILSGIVEILLGASLLFLASKRVQVGWVVALFFVLIFPGNVSQYVNGIDAFGLDTDRARFIRLFFQPVLIVMALWSTGAWQAWRNKN
ncbi:hypothetical protein M3O96_04500 [Aquiflexum sp. TKW24L]|uniref:DoxX family protein n=1 Tax=Aquiflexum sp. TKW24L TaxID=2942212 RepID=UPI0020C03F50|nr:hypothetical protein [Aquiflexum sp. TKW24L]MCL6258334.1 hypothetical protein [Aquiflexum sp. TKW24L]